MPVGDHTTKLTKSGYNDWETTKYVYADENVGVSTTLIPELMDCTSVVHIIEPKFNKSKNDFTLSRLIFNINALDRL